MKSTTIRKIAVLASATLVLGAFVAGTADAGKRKKKKPPVVVGCPAPTFADPATASESRPDPAAKLTTVTDAATAEAPVTVEFEHGPAFWETVTQTPVQEDTQWFPIQIDSATDAGLYVRLDWAIPSPSDIDLYVWDAGSGEELAHSGAANIFPVNVPLLAETGAMGYESISGALVSDCAGFLVESRAFTTAGESVTLSLWLGEPAA